MEDGFRFGLLKFLWPAEKRKCVWTNREIIDTGFLIQFAFGLVHALAQANFYANVKEMLKLEPALVSKLKEILK